MMLLYIYILWLAVCVDSTSADQIITVTAAVGSTTLLPCKLTSAFTSESVVHWYVNTQVVFERSGSGGSIAGSEYKGRVDVPEDELRKRNCSLVLKNVRLNDDSFYKTFVMEHVKSSKTNKEFNRVKLSVVLLIISAPVGSTVLLPCEWSNLSIQTPHVEWNIDSEVVFERKGKESIQGEGYEGRVDVPEDELLKGNCSLVMKNVSVTDENVYRSSMMMKLTEKSVLVQKVKLSVYKKSERVIDVTSAPSGEAGINSPRQLILIISLLVFLLV